MKTARCHPDRPHYAKWLCRQCYDAQRTTHDPDWYKKHYQENKEKVKAQCHKYWETHRAERNAARKVLRDGKRAEVIAHYGGKCACCGETELKFLSIDHIDGGGNQHRKETSLTMSEWVWANGFPDGFQVLCYNCNMAKALYGSCPHQDKE
jgi:hypothetical protein